MADWKLAIVGAADHSSEYTSHLELIARKNSGVVLAGLRRGEELASLYSHAGVFCLPSSHEGLSLALLEALSYGVPVVASDIRANLEVGLPTGSYFPLGDTEALAFALRSAAADAFDVKASQRRRDLVSARHDWELIADRTLEVMVAVSRHAAAQK